MTSKMISSVNKLLKMPLRGNSSKIPADAVLPFIIVPISIYTASFSLYWTLAVFFCLICMIIYLRRSLLQTQPRSHFFIMWLVSSVLWLLVVFNIYVIKLLEILPEENLLLVVLATGSIICLYNAKTKAHQMETPTKSSYMNDVEASNSNDIQPLIIDDSHEVTFCHQCQANIPNRESHSVWLDCCVGSNNKRYFLSGIFLGMSALFYGSNLTLTTVCHPFILYKTILLPDDCSDVYYEFSIAMCFVCGLYSLVIGSFMLFFLMKRIIVKAGGFTGHRWTHVSSMKTWQNNLVRSFHFRTI